MSSISQDLSGRTVIITGGSSGLGFASAVKIFNANAHVIITTRNDEKGRKAVKEVEATRTANNKRGTVEYGVIEHSDLKSVEAFANSFLARNIPLYALINNAGVMFPPFRAIHNVESTVFIDHVSGFHLTNLLLPALEKSPQSARIVNVASGVPNLMKIDEKGIDWDYYFRRPTSEGYDHFNAYSVAKLLNIIHAAELARRLPPSSTILANSLHPGLVASHLVSSADGGHVENPAMAQVINWVEKDGVTPEKGSETQVWLATDPNLTVTGKYFEGPSLDQMRPSIKEAWDPTLARMIWKLSEDAVKRALAH